MKTENWFSKAACKGKDTDFFYPEPGTIGYGKAVTAAKAVCNLCVVKSNCLDYAIENDEAFGIWGGFLPKERRKISGGNVIKSKDIKIRKVKENDHNQV